MTKHDLADRLYEFDWKNNVEKKRPDYARLFQILDELNVKHASDAEAAFRTWHPERSIVGHTIWDSIRYVMASGPGLRVISDGPDAELVFFTRLLCDEAVVLSDCEVAVCQRDIGNPIHT